MTSEKEMRKILSDLNLARKQYREVMARTNIGRDDIKIFVPQSKISEVWDIITDYYHGQYLVAKAIARDAGIATEEDDNERE